MTVVALLILQVVYSSLSNLQLQSNGHELGGPSAACTCPGGGGVSSTDLAASIASLVKVYAPNSDFDAVIRGIQLPDPANYTPVFAFNEPHSTDLITHGYAKVANIENYPATHNQAISQRLF